MGAKHLSDREIWQTETGEKATENEKKTALLLKESLNKSNYKVVVKPTIKLGDLTLRPELKITNLFNKKTLLIDDKLGEKGGNAHERMYKYFTSKVENAGYTCLIVLSGRTFAAKERFTYVSKKGKKVKVNPEKYRTEFKQLLDEDQYFIRELDCSNNNELLVLIQKLLA